jgi:hypothetical protein
LGLIPDQQPMSVSSTAEGVGVDKDGNVFGAEVGRPEGPEEISQEVAALACDG